MVRSILLITFLAQSALSMGDDWTAILEAMSFQRKSLVSGEFRAHGTEKQMESELSVPVTITCRFDFGSDRLVFDETKGSRRHIHAPFQQETYHFTNVDSPRLFITSPGLIRLPGRRGTNGCFDVRALGLVRYEDLYESKRLSEALESWKSSKNVQEVSPRIFEVSYATKRQRVTIWIDGNQGYTIQRLEVENGRLVGGEFKKNSEAMSDRDIQSYKKLNIDVGKVFPDQASIYEIGWNHDEQKDVWVPGSLSIQGTSLPQAKVEAESTTPSVSVMTYAMELQFEWSSINKNIDDRLFDYQYWDLPDGTPVYDLKNSQSKLVDRISESSSLIVPESKGRRKIMLYLFVAATICIFAVAIRHARSR